MTELTDLAVRAARAELERDQALERAERAEEQVRQAYQRFSDPEEFAKTMTICGIPALDVADIYRTVAEWQRQGGRPKLLDLYRELEQLRRDEVPA